jgi:hypothetical protein
MELSNLVRPRGFGAAPAGGALALFVLLLFVLLLGSVSGCHSGVAGGQGSDAGIDAAVDLVIKLPPPDADCPADAAGGGGQCPLNFCGSVVAGATGQLGADDLCTPGYACVPGGPTAKGDALQLRCVTPFVPATELGADCATGAAATNRCKNDALCITAPAAPGHPFCSALCRTDGDCPQDTYCLEYPTSLPGGASVNVGFCTPASKIAGQVCAREADCPADEGCVEYGPRTALLTCQKLGGTKSMGAACAAGTECRSGQCSDRDFHANVNRSFCSGDCGKNSDCGPDQRCVRVVLGTNGTPADPRDDHVAGLCQSLFVSVAAAGCTKDADCTDQKTGDTCSTKYGLCYTAGAASGAPCALDQQCALGAGCTTTLPGGYCQTQGCASGAAAGSVDSCPGADAVCAQRGSDVPLHACYEGCAQSGDCSRFAKNYVCETPAGMSASGIDAGVADASATDGGDAGAPALLICLYSQGN